MTDRTITLFHAPRTRSSGVLTLLEELGAVFKLEVLDPHKGDLRSAAYLAINPMGKVPALRDGDAIVTEQVAIYIYLADRFPAAGLAPALDDALRGPYLRWMAFYAGCFEPAVVDRAMQREPGTRAMSPYGDYETVLNTLEATLGKGPYLLGDRFSAADVLWGSGLSWTMLFKLVPERPMFVDYVHRVTSRPAAARARAKDEALAAAQEG